MFGCAVLPLCMGVSRVGLIVLPCAGNWMLPSKHSSLCPGGLCISDTHCHFSLFSSLCFCSGNFSVTTTFPFLGQSPPFRHLSCVYSLLIQHLQPYDCGQIPKLLMLYCTLKHIWASEDAPRQYLITGRSFRPSTLQGGGRAEQHPSSRSWGQLSPSGPRAVSSALQPLRTSGFFKISV